MSSPWFCRGCGAERAGEDRILCRACDSDSYNAADVDVVERRKRSYSVVLKRVPYAGRWVRRDTLLARDVSKDEARVLASEYRATGWKVDVFQGDPPRDVYVPVPVPTKQTNKTRGEA